MLCCAFFPPAIKQVVAENAASSIDSAHLAAKSILDEIAHKMALPAVRSLAGVLRSIFTRILSAIYVNVEGREVVLVLDRGVLSSVAEPEVVSLAAHRGVLRHD